MDKFYVSIFYIFRFFVKYTPKLILSKFFDFLAWCLYKFDEKHKKVVKVNLDLVFRNSLTEVEKKNIIKQCYTNLIHNLADFVRNQGITKEELSSKVSFENENFIQEAIKSNKKIIVLTAHYGNWELLGPSIAARFIPLSVVGRDLDAPSMQKILAKNRKQFDIELLSKSGAMKGMIKALKRNRAVGILVDQNTKDDESVIVDFFNQRVRHTPSVALLAKKFDAVIIPVFIKTYDNENFIIKFEEPFTYEDTGNKEEDILRCVQKQANITEQIILEKPDEWFWFHKRFKYNQEHIYE